MDVVRRTCAATRGGTHEEPGIRLIANPGSRVHFQVKRLVYYQGGVPSRRGLANEVLAVSMFGSSETHLKEHPGLSQAAVARGVLVTPQSIGEIVATMESAGLVTRTPPPRPGGPISVEITTYGRSKLTATFPLVGTINTPAALGLNGDEARTLNGLLHRVHDHLDNRVFKPLPDGV